MNFTIRLTGSKEVRDRLAGIKLRSGDLGPAFLGGATVLLDAAQHQIESGGDGAWPPTAQSSPGRSLYRNGNLYRSFSIGGADNLYQQIPGGVRVGTNYQENGWNIGALMQFGTGIFGPKGQPIVPTAGKALVFMLNGRKVVRRSVKGTPKRPILFFSDPTAHKILLVIAKYVEGKGAGP